MDLIRLVLAAIGFAIRQFSRNRQPSASGMLGDTPYFVRLNKHKGRIKGFSIGMERAHADVDSPARRKPGRSAVQVDWHRERSADRRSRVRSPRVRHLRSSARGDRADRDRGASDRPSSRCSTTAITGSRLTALSSGPTAGAIRNRPIAMSNCSRPCGLASARLSDAPAGRTADRFLWKALVVEGVIWSIAGYAIGGGLETIFSRADVHVSASQLWTTAMYVALAAFAALLLVIVVWLRGSSRGHRVIIESALVLLVAIPLTSVQVVADTNRALDQSTTTIVEHQFTRCETRQHRRRRGGVTYSYHLHLTPDSDTPGPRASERDRDRSVAVSRGRQARHRQDRRRPRTLGHRRGIARSRLAGRPGTAGCRDLRTAGETGETRAGM